MDRHRSNPVQGAAADPAATFATGDQTSSPGDDG